MSVNSRIGIPTNLPQGGTYDLLIVKFPNGFPESQLLFNIDDTPRKVTGIQKVSQTFIKTLFTSVGSDVLKPNYGTRFQSLTVNANISDNDSVFMSELTDQIKSAENQTKAILNNRLSDAASQLDKIVILGLDTGKESVVIYLRIITKDGEYAQIAVPFPELNLKLTEQVRPT